MPPPAITSKPFLTAQWRHLAFLNFEIDPSVLKPFVPAGTQLDPFDGTHFVSIVGFMFLDTRLKGFPIPFHRNFEEVNLRFYVVRETDDGPKRGVVFITEAAPRWAVVKVARWAYNENYVYCKMSHQFSGAACGEMGPPKVAYRWRQQAELAANLQCVGELHSLKAGSHEEFIAEHYYGFSRQRNGGTFQYQVDHPPWQIYQGESGELTGDVGAFYGKEFEAALQAKPYSMFYADGSDVSVAKPIKIA